MFNIDQELRSRYAEIAAFHFPKKSKLSTFAKFTKERRREGFDDYLRLVCTLTPQPQEVLAFLDIKNNAPAAVVPTTETTTSLASTIPNLAVTQRTGSQSVSSEVDGALGLASLPANATETNVARRALAASTDSSLVSAILVTGSAASLLAFALRFFVVTESLAGHPASQGAVFAFAVAVTICARIPQLLLQKISSL